MKEKVNVWQVGFMDRKSSMLKDGSQAVCKERGYVLVENDEYWEEEAWNLLNWSCWTDEKPEDVHSQLDHCNADIIVQKEGTCCYKAAQFAGFKNYSSLDMAVEDLKSHPCELWCFPEAPREYSRYKTDGETVWGSNDSETWVKI